MENSILTPLVRKIFPLSVRAGANDVELVLQGENLGGVTDMLFLDGGITVRSFRVSSSYKLEAHISVDRFAPAGYRYLMLVDPLAGIGVARQQVRIECCPEIRLVQPCRLVRGSHGIHLWLVGSGFSRGENAVISGEGVNVYSTDYLAPHTMVALVDVETDAPLGRRDICVAGMNVSGRASAALEIAAPGPIADTNRHVNPLAAENEELSVNPYDWS